MAEFDTTVSTRFSYLGGGIAIEVANPGGAILRRYVAGPDPDEVLVWYEGTGASDRRYLIADERGSIVAATDASGTATATAAYDEYGIPSGGNVGRFGYTGQAFLPEIGLSYYKARMYSPTLGRFMQTDPIGYGDGMNWYNYIGSNPVNATDPSGKMVQYCTGSILPSSTGCGGGASPMTTIGGTWSCTNCGEGAKSDGANGLVVNAPIWVFKPSANATSNMGYLPQNGEGDDIVVTGTRQPQVTIQPQPQFFSIAGNIWDSGLPRDVEQLKSMLEEAKRSGDTQMQRRIIKQLKAAGVRNIQKLRGIGKFRAFPFLFIIPDVLRVQMCAMPGNSDPTCPDGA